MRCLVAGSRHDVQLAVIGCHQKIAISVPAESLIVTNRAGRVGLLGIFITGKQFILAILRAIPEGLLTAWGDKVAGIRFAECSGSQFL